MRGMRVIYIAGPFRGPTAWDVAENIRAAERLAFEVATAGHVPLCPHANTAHFDGTMTGQFWLDATMELMRRCDAVLFTSNWRESEGARAEQIAAAELGMPQFFSVAEMNRAGARPITEEL